MSHRMRKGGRAGGLGGEEAYLGRRHRLLFLLHPGQPPSALPQCPGEGEGGPGMSGGGWGGPTWKTKGGMRRRM